MAWSEEGGPSKHQCVVTGVEGGGGQSVYGESKIVGGVYVGFENGLKNVKVSQSGLDSGPNPYF